MLEIPKEDAIDLEDDTFYLPLDDVVEDELEELGDQDDEEDEVDYEYYENVEEVLKEREKIEREKKKKWSIVFSKKPELIIEKEEYDRILIDLLQSYADYKQTTIKMADLIEIEDEQII